MKKRLIIAGIVLIAGIAVTLYFPLGNSRDQEDLMLSGNVEVTEANMGSRYPGRVRRLFTDEGRTVSKGDKIATLDNAELESMVNQNMAAVKNAEAQYRKSTARTMNGSRPSIATALLRPSRWIRQSPPMMWRYRSSNCPVQRSGPPK